MIDLNYILTSADLAKELNISLNSLKNRVYRANKAGDNFYQQYYKKIGTMKFWKLESVEALKQRHQAYMDMKRKNLTSYTKVKKIKEKIK